MKKYLFYCFLFLLCGNAFAQTEKQDFILGGTIHGAYKRNNVSFEEKRWSLSEDVRIGYFLFKNFAVGILPSYSYTNYQVIYNQTTIDQFSSFKSKYHQFSFDPFIRYYVLRRGDWGIFAEGAAGITYAKSKTVDLNFSTIVGPNTTVEHHSYFNYKVGAGGNFFLSSKAALELGVGFQHYSIKNGQEAFGNFKDNLALSVGLMLFL